MSKSATALMRRKIMRDRYLTGLLIFFTCTFFLLIGQKPAGAATPAPPPPTAIGLVDSPGGGSTLTSNAPPQGAWEYTYSSGGGGNEWFETCYIIGVYDNQADAVNAACMLLNSLAGTYSYLDSDTMLYGESSSMTFPGWSESWDGTGFSVVIGATPIVGGYTDGTGEIFYVFPFCTAASWYNPIPPPSHFGPGTNSGDATEPVNTALGNYVHQHADLKVSGDPGLKFVRTYNSQDTYQGPLGYCWTHSYNIFLTVSGSSVTVKYADGHVEEYTSNGSGTFTPCWGGIYSTLVQNQNGTCSITNKAQTVYNFASNGQLISIVDKNGNTVSLVYTGSNLTSVVGSSGRTLSFSYDSSNRITSITDPLGRTVSYTYDVNGNLASNTDADGGKWSYQYDSSHEATQIVNPSGNVLVANTYTNSQVTSQANGLGNTTTFQYNTPNTGDTTVTDPMGRKTVYSHDSKFELTQLVNPLGQTVSYTYDANEDRTSITDVRGNFTGYTYDAMGNVTSKTDALWNVTSITYDALNDPLTVTDALGNKTTFTYDSKGNLLTAADALGDVTSFAYMPTGEISSITNANGNSSTFSYDGAGDLLGAKDSLGDSTAYTCDAAGRKLSVTDANGQKTTFVYDGDDNPVSVTDPDGKAATFAYDADNNLISVTDKDGVATSYAYNVLNEAVSVGSPDTGVTTLTYDPDGEVQTRTDANGITRTFSYDAAGRLTSIIFPDSSQNIALSYDAAATQTGFLTGVTDPSGVSAYQHDALGRIVQETATVIGVAYTTGYQYDKDGNLVSETYPDGRQVAYPVNAVNLPVGMSETQAGQATSLASNFSYDKVGNLLALAYGNGLVMQRVYDAANRLAQMTVPGVMELSYTRDPVGDITAMAGNPVPDFGAVGVTGRYSYQGNRLLAVSAGRGTKPIDYDADGNITGDGDLDFTYNQGNHLAEVLHGRRVLGQYTYNWKGQRVEKNVHKNGVTVFHYDLAGRLIEETNAEGQAIADYIYLGLNPLAMVESVAGQDEIYFYHDDHLGAPDAMTGQGGQIVWMAGFDPFGNAISGGGGITNNLRFPGQYHDRETGLNYNGNRYYDPTTGRYTQPDPIGLQGGLNRFVYVRNNPVNWVDPRGLQGFGIYYDSGMVSAAALGEAGDYGEQQYIYPDSTDVAELAGSIALVPAVALGGPAAVAVAITVVLSNPVATAYILNSATDFISNYYVTGPPVPNIWGYLGVGLSIYNDPESYGLSNSNSNSNSSNGCK